MGRTIKLAAVRPNAGLELEYRRKLERLIDEMHRSVDYWLGAAYKSEMAQDASPAMMINAVMKRLIRKWTKKFAEVAPTFAEYFATAVKDRTDAQLRAALKKSGFTVKFNVTPEIKDIMQAAVAENVSLIKTIPAEYLADVQQMAMRSVMAGRDLGGLRADLQKRYGITKRRAQLIARQSNNNASAEILKARQTKLGITEAVWHHSHAGKHPRPEHERWNGTTFKITEGKWSEVSKKWVWPGTDFNCRCTSRSIIPGQGRQVQPSNEVLFLSR